MAYEGQIVDGRTMVVNEALKIVKALPIVAAISRNTGGDTHEKHTIGDVIRICSVLNFFLM
ncbi:MAG: hypothetical protein Q8S19_06450, partial [Bacillota bacterium]|nr:hypothetical protein [Bacillota bacterium]